MSGEEPAAALCRLLGVDGVAGLERLTGGASRETWAFTAGGRAMVLRRDPPGWPGERGGMAREAAAMRACREAGLRVPEVLAEDDGALLGTAGIVMAAVPGESIARRILRDERFARARPVLAAQLGDFLGGLHSLDPAAVPGLADLDTLAAYWAAYENLPSTSRTFERAYAWLDANRPPSPPRTIVHGDCRMGNVIVDEDGLAAVIDWELVHAGDPLEDLGWLCVKAWRFGSPLPAGGVGELDDLLGAYEARTGTPVDRDALHWWLVAGTLRWGITCMAQANVHLSGVLRSVELAAIGRRTCEQEWDLIELLAPEAWREARDGPLPPAVADATGHGRPTARELLEAVREFLAGDVMGATSGRVGFHARVAANALAIVERELAQPPVPPDGDDWPSLARAVRQRVAAANPKWL